MLFHAKLLINQIIRKPENMLLEEKHGSGNGQFCTDCVLTGAEVI
jgi:hypothetical protein